MGRVRTQGLPRPGPPHLADVFEVLDVYPLAAHDLLDDVGPHLLLALCVLVGARVHAALLLLTVAATGTLWRLFLVDTKLQETGDRDRWLGDREAAPGERQETPGSCLSRASWGQPGHGLRVPVPGRAAVMPSSKAALSTIAVRLPSRLQ